MDGSGDSQRWADALGLKRNLVLLLVAIVLIGGLAPKKWMRFVPKYLQALGAGVFVIGLFDVLKTLLGAVYAWPGGVLSDRRGHRRALVFFNVLSVAGYALVAFVPHWSAVLVGMLLFLAWSCLSLPATFSLIATSLAANRHATGVAVQSVIKRLPIIVGPILGGLLIDRFGIVSGVGSPCSSRLCSDSQQSSSNAAFTRTCLRPMVRPEAYCTSPAGFHRR